MVSGIPSGLHFPSLPLSYPEHYRLFLEGFLNSYRDTGFLPKWLAPDERGMMPGTLLDGIIADSACKDMAPNLEEELLKPCCRQPPSPTLSASMVVTD